MVSEFESLILVEENANHLHEDEARKPSPAPFLTENRPLQFAQMNMLLLSPVGFNGNLSLLDISHFCRGVKQMAGQKPGNRRWELKEAH